MEYRRILRQLETQMFVNCKSHDDKLSYLDQYTTGEPNKIVRGYSYLNATKDLKLLNLKTHMVMLTLYGCV